MVKIYKLKYNLPTFWKGDICVLDESGDLWWVGNEIPELDKKERTLHWKDQVCMYNQQTLDRFNILETYFEEIEGIDKFWPFKRCRYFYLSDAGVEWDIWEDNEMDHSRKAMGNCFLKEKDAKRAWKKIESLCKMRNLGVQITSFNLLEDGKGHLTFKFSPEFFDKTNDSLKEMIELDND